MAGASFKQFAAIFITGQALIAMGFNFGLHSITVIQVPQDEDRFMDDDQLNWTLAVGPLACLLGALLSVPAAGPLGARRLLMLAMPVYAVTSLMACFGGSFVWVLISRSAMFTMLGMLEGTVRGYASEIVPPNGRALTSAIGNAFVFGSQAVALIVAKYVHWTTIFLISGFLPTVICLAGLFFIPNSAKWLVSHGHTDEEARHSLLFFFGEHYDADAEIKEIKDSVAHAHVDGESVSVWWLVLQRSTLLPLLLACAQMTMNVWTGGFGVSYITSYILEPVQLPIDDYQSAMLPAALAAVVAIPASLLIERCGRLPMLRFSGLLSAAGCITIATYFFVSAELQERLGPMALAGATAAQLAFSAFIAPISLMFGNELLPNRTRLVGANIVMGWVYGQLFILVRCYPLMKNAIGFSGTFVVHGVVSVLQVLLATFCLPETSGLTLEQIQRLFVKGEKSADVPLSVGGRSGERGVENPALDITDSKQL